MKFPCSFNNDTCSFLEKSYSEAKGIAYYDDGEQGFPKAVPVEDDKFQTPPLGWEAEGRQYKLTSGTCTH